MTMRSMPSEQRGVIALLPVMLLASIMVSLLAAVFYHHERSIAQLTRSVMTRQAMLYALSFELWAQRLLDQDAAMNRTDSLSDMWARPVKQLPFDGATVSGCIVDEQALFDLNAFAAYSRERLDQELASDSSSLARAFLYLLNGTAAGNTAPVARLVDWLDADSDMVSVDGAEDQAYIRTRPQRRPANRPMSQAAELNLVLGFGERESARLRELTTALPAPSRFNINTVEPRVLEALVSDEARSLVPALLSARPFRSTQQMVELLMQRSTRASLADVAALLDPGLFDVESRHFMIAAVFDVNEIRIDYRAHLQRGSDGHARVYARSASVIPALADELLKPGELPSVCAQNARGVKG